MCWNLSLQVIEATCGHQILWGCKNKAWFFYISSGIRQFMTWNKYESLEVLKCNIKAMFMNDDLTNNFKTGISFKFHERLQRYWWISYLWIFWFLTSEVKREKEVVSCFCYVSNLCFGIVLILCTCRTIPILCQDYKPSVLDKCWNSPGDFIVLTLYNLQDSCII